MHDVVYDGWCIEPTTTRLPEGGFRGKVTIRPVGDQAGATRLVWLPERWGTENEAWQRAIQVGTALIDAGRARPRGADADGARG